MNIRKFEGESFEEALHRVKAELGPEALILSTEERRRGWFQKPIVEITAAFEVKEEKEWDDSALETIFPHRRRKSTSPFHETEIEPPKKSKATPKNTARLVTHAPVNTSATQSTEQLERQFLEMGVTLEAARDFSRQIHFDYPKKDREDSQFLEKIQAKFLSTGIKTLGPDIFQTRRSWAAVGGPGSGKTSLLVKLGLALKGQGQDILLASCDGRKIVGRHELAAYAKLIGVPYGGFEKRPTQLVLLDTPSLNWSKADSVKETARNCRDASTFVVLDASARLSELLKTVERVASLAPVAIAFTRLDQVSQVGVVYEVLKQTKLPLLGASLSQGFSAAFRFFEPVSLARYIIQKPHEDDQKRGIIESAANGSTESIL